MGLSVLNLQFSEELLTPYLALMLLFILVFEDCGQILI
jgi:hypothetical protein